MSSLLVGMVFSAPGQSFNWGEGENMEATAEEGVAQDPWSTQPWQGGRMQIE